MGFTRDEPCLFGETGSSDAFCTSVLAPHDWLLYCWVLLLQIFPSLLKNTSYVTTDPEAADYFFADAWIFWPHAGPLIQNVVKTIQRKGPWFDRKNGSDHIFAISADQGRCNGYHSPLVRNSIFVQHYGGRQGVFMPGYAYSCMQRRRVGRLPVDVLLVQQKLGLWFSIAGGGGEPGA